MTTQRASVLRKARAIPSRIAWSSALRFSGFEIVSRRTPSAGSSCNSSPGTSRDPTEAYSSTTRTSPSLTAWPSSQRISLTVPSSSASTGISIFIDSRITTVSPSATRSPTSHSIFHTVPVMWASMSGTRSSSSIARECNLPGGVILAIDQGTSGTTCLVFDGEAELVGRAAREFTQHFPRPGWVEHDADEIWEVTQAVAGEALEDAGVAPGELVAVGITNQRETVCVWDPETGEPLHRALVWQDRRTADRCDELREAGHEELVRERTGLVIDPYFSGTKIEWLIRNGDLPERAVFGTIDSWLVFKLTGRHLTDYTNASRTLLFDTHELAWDSALCELLGVAPASLPEPLPSSQSYGTTSEF